jgi:preprotein translocase subunit YajC
MNPNHLNSWHPLQGQSLLHLSGQVPASGGQGTVAQHAGPTGQTPSAPSMFGNIAPLLIFGVIFYMMVFRPMSKQNKDREEVTKSLKKGDRVVTNGGMIGTITGLDDREIVLEVSEKVKVKFLRSAVERKYDPTANTETAQSDKSSRDSK